MFYALPVLDGQRAIADGSTCASDALWALLSHGFAGVGDGPVMIDRSR